MRRLGLAAIAVMALMNGPTDEAGAGWRKKRGNCSGCSAPVMVGCSAPLASCAGPYGYGCSGCYAPSCGSPYGYQANYVMPSCYAPSCGRPAFYGSSCGGCSAPVYGCAASCARPEYNPYVYLPNPYVNGYAVGAAGCGGCARPEYAPYVYQPNPYVNHWGVGAPVGYGQVIGSSTYPQVSNYNAPAGVSFRDIPPMPPAEDVLW